MRGPSPSSPYRRRALERAHRAAARARAPKHPAAPESALRLTVNRIFTLWHAHLKQIAITHAPHRARLDSHADRLRRDVARATASDSIFAGSWSYAWQLLHGGPFKKAVGAAAQRTADSATKQTREALDLGDKYQPDLSKPTEDLTADIFDGTEALMRDSLERAETTFDEWSDLDPEESPRAGDVDALGDMLDVGLAGAAGLGLALVARAFGYAFSQLIRGAQEAAGVGEYYWMAQRDSVVRPEHLALDNGEAYSWDDPPLKADVSSNEEDDHAGEDYGCRCVASPKPPETSIADDS